MTCPAICPSEWPHRAGWAPCLRDSQGSDLNNVSWPARFWAAPGLAAYPVELGKALAESGKVTFRATGGCMAPNVQPGDILHVVPKQAGQIEIGEIALCLRGGKLIGHRTVARGEDELGSYIVTRSDRSAGETDAPSHDGDILGVVVRVERNGRAVAATGGQPGGPASATAGPRLKLGQAAGPAGKRWRLGIQARLMRGLSWFQDSLPYRRAAARWRGRQREQMEYVVCLPYAANPALPFVQKLADEEIERLDLRAGSTGMRWAITATISGREAASLTFLCRPAGCPFAGWWLTGIKVRIRFRGAGLEEELLRRAERILAGSGVSYLRADPPGDSDAERWCRRLGFASEVHGPFASGKPGELPTAVLTRIL